MFPKIIVLADNITGERICKELVYRYTLVPEGAFQVFNGSVQELFTEIYEGKFAEDGICSVVDVTLQTTPEEQEELRLSGIMYLRVEDAFC